MGGSFNKNSFIYTATTIFQKGVAFFLIPIYSVYIDPKEYGIISLVLAIVAILTVFFTLSFDSAIVRFYYDYKNDPIELRRKISTLFFALILNSSFAFVVFVSIGPSLFEWILPNISFYPYIFLGLLILVFQPFYLLVLGFCQTTENAKGFSIISIGYFLTHLFLTITLVVIFNLGGLGILLATLASSLLFSFVGLVYLREYFVPVFEMKFIKDALKYTLPLMPHSIAGQLSVTVDRFLLNGLLNAKVTGVYFMGYQLSYPVDVVALSFNRAFVPTYFNNIEDPEGRITVAKNASIFFAATLVAAFGLSIWGSEIFKYIIDDEYFESLNLLSIISFSFVATVIYYLHSCVFFYQKNKVYLVPLCTISANILNVILNIIFIPKYGIYGAAFSTLFSQTILAAMAFSLGRKIEKLDLPTYTYFALLVIIFSLSFFINEYCVSATLMTILTKVFVSFMGIIFISLLLWKNPFTIFKLIFQIKTLFKK